MTPQQKPLRPLELQRFIRVRYDDLNPETLYKLAMLILFDADFGRTNNCFGKCHKPFWIVRLLHELVG